MFVTITLTFFPRFFFLLQNQTGENLVPEQKDEREKAEEREDAVLHGIPLLGMGRRGTKSKKAGVLLRPAGFELTLSLLSATAGQELQQQEKSAIYREQHLYTNRYWVDCGGGETTRWNKCFFFKTWYNVKMYIALPYRCHAKEHTSHSF